MIAAGFAALGFGRPLASRGTALLAACALGAGVLGLGGCGSSGAVLTQDAYAGPPLEVTERGKFYMLRFQAPSAGWRVTLDEVRPSLDNATLLVTAREPDPSYMHAQVVVTQDVLTTVETSTPIVVHARVTPFVSKSKSPTYPLVGQFGPKAGDTDGATDRASKPQP